MNFVNQRTRPVKRCRRGRCQNNSPSINFNGGYFNSGIVLQESSHISVRKKTFFWVSVLCALFVSLCLLLVGNFDNVEASGIGNFMCISSLQIDRSSLFTKSALHKITKLIHPNKTNGPITLRDASRFIKKYEKLRAGQAMLRRKNKKLMVLCKQLEDKVKPLQQKPIGKEVALITENAREKQQHILVEHREVCDEKDREIKENLTGTQFKNEEIANTEAGRLIKVWLGGNCSFRSFSRIINGLIKQNLYRGNYCPSPNTLINWSVRAGIAKLKGVKRSKGPCIDIMDHWIGKGDCKIFAVLRMSKSKYKKRNKSLSALALSDFELIHLEIMRKSNGERVCSSLSKLYEKIGSPVAIISDSGSDLVKGLELLNEKNLKSKKIHHIKDISHKLACAFKKEYENVDWFKEFFAILGNGNNKLQNTMFANLKSPTQNTKARFMNICKQVEWYIDKLNSIQGGKLNDKECIKFKEVYGDLKKYKSEIEDLHKTIILSHKIMQILKVKGLSKESSKESLKIISSSQGNKKVKQSIIDWLAVHQEINKKLTTKGHWEISIPITSDPIESFFSKFKIFHKRVPQGDPTRLIAILPLIVGDNTATEIHNFISTVSYKDALEWIEENVPETIHSKKRKLCVIGKGKKRTKSGNANDHRKRPYQRAIAA